MPSTMTEQQRIEIMNADLAAFARRLRAAQPTIEQLGKNLSDFGALLQDKLPSTASAAKGLAGAKQAKINRKDSTMTYMCQIIGGPMDGEMHADRGKTFEVVNSDGQTVVWYQRHQMTQPVGKEQAVFIYAPREWTLAQINQALLDKFPSRNRRNQIG